MILWLILIIILLLLAGPLRRPYLRHAAFTVPATVGGIAGFLFGMFVMALAGTPAPFSLLIPLAMAVGAALGLGESVKAWRDRTFPREERPHDRR